MPQQIVIAEQLRIAAVLSDERVDELIVAQGRHQIGDVYLGTVENVLPGIDAALPASGGRNNPTIDSNMDKNDIEAFSDERSTEKELEYKNSDNKDSQSKGSE